METLKYISSDPETRAISDLRQKTINDHTSEMTVAREEGRAEGKAEEKIEIAKNLLSLGVDTLTVANASKLSIERIKSLKENIHGIQRHE
jgi:predicted transposase/invertase (TIGR01784 family)